MDDGMVAFSDPQWLQGDFSTLVGLFDSVLLRELTIRSVGRTLEKEITRIENVPHANRNIDSVIL